MNLPDWLYQDVPNDISGWFLLIAFIVTMVWGVSAITAAIRERNRPGTRPFWQTFRFWFGIFLVWCDGIFYGIVSLGILRGHEDTDLWGVLLTISWGIVAAIAFLTWAREEAEARR